MQTSNYLFVLLEYCPQMAETSLSKNVIETGGRNIPMMIMPHCPPPIAGHKGLLTLTPLYPTYPPQHHTSPGDEGERGTGEEREGGRDGGMERKGRRRGRRRGRRGG